MRVPLEFTAGRKSTQRLSAKPAPPGSEPCLICGLPIKDPKTARYVEVDTSMSAIVGEPENGPDSQGAFPVGPECWRKLPAEVRKAGGRVKFQDEGPVHVDDQTGWPLKP